MKALFLFLLLTHSIVCAKVAVFWQEGFPFVDTKEISKNAIEDALKNEEIEFLDSSATFQNLRPTTLRLRSGQAYDLIIFTHGSAFPESAWPAIKSYLSSGGNLLILGGKPFTAAINPKSSYDPLTLPSPSQPKADPPLAERGEGLGEGDQKNKAYNSRFTLAFSKELLINDTFEIPKSRLSQVVQQKLHENFAFLELPQVEFEQAFAMTIRLSSQELYNRLGSWGSIDAKWEGLLYGNDQKNRQLVALASYVDHFQNQFIGSRWVFTNFDPKEGYWETLDGKKLIQTLAAFAKKGALSVRLQPTLANYREKEKTGVTLYIENPKNTPQDFELNLQLIKNGKAIESLTTFRKFNAQHFEDTFRFRANLKPGFYEVSLTLKEGSRIVGQYKTGFWRENLKNLSRGEPWATNTHYLTREGKSYPVVGTTYMASDVHRYFLSMPNPYIFEKDFTELESAGMNMIRTGIWTGYDKLTNADGSAKEETLRALEAFLLSAKRHGIPVQFCFFSFIPDVFGGKNPYLDPEAKQKQKNYILSFVNRFKDNPDVMWDLINEPSFSNPTKIFSGNVPNGDEFELAAWNEWLIKRHGSLEGVAQAWNTSKAFLEEQLISPSPIPSPLGRGQGEGTLIPLPQLWEMKVNWNAIYWGWTKPLKAYDYNLFAQEKFNEWAREMAGAIRATGSNQLITVGQDEGGSTNRILNHFYGDEVDFTTNHSWWQNDALAWDSVVSKRQDKPNLIQETGIMHNEVPDESSRMDESAKARLLEKKCAMALGAEGAGVIQWAWNINVYMKDDNEVTIGAVRGDGTQKPEADVLRRFSDFVGESAPYFDPPEQPNAALLIPESLQLSLYNDLAIEATQKAVRTLHYYNKASAYAVSERKISEGHASNPSLIILPSAQILSEPAWQGLLKIVSLGATALITGPIERDEYFRPTPRLTSLNPKLSLATLTSRETQLNLNSNSSPTTHDLRPLTFSYSGHKMNRLDFEKLEGSTSLEEIPYGQGRFLVSPYPVELNDNLEPIGQLYQYALDKSKTPPLFKTNNANPGILIRPTAFPKAILYLLVSESNTSQDIAVEDLTTGATISLTLPPERSALILLDKKTGQTLASYTPESF